jgi:hypothetical protein
MVTCLQLEVSSTMMERQRELRGKRERERTLLFSFGQNQSKLFLPNFKRRRVSNYSVNVKETRAGLPFSKPVFDT